MFTRKIKKTLSAFLAAVMTAAAATCLAGTAADADVPLDENGNPMNYVCFTDTISDIFIVPVADSYGMIGMVGFMNSPIYCIYDGSRSELYGGIEDYKVGSKVDIECWCTGTDDGVEVADMLSIRKISVIKPAGTLYGDANCDGIVTIADSTAILQSMANQDKYGLSDQGNINADCCGIGGGVTGLDALAIQRLDAKMIDSLPILEEK